jgi:cation/acetate symporter
LITGVPIPQLGLGAEVSDGSGLSVLGKLDATLLELGFAPYTNGAKSTLDVFAITMALMIGTAGLPHVIVRFFTVPKVSDARKSAGYALLFIALLYTTAPAVGAFARLNFIDTVHNTPYTNVAQWFKNWEDIGLIGWLDKSGDGSIQYGPGAAFAGKPEFADGRGQAGERLVINTPTPSANEVYVDRDIMVLANPEIASLPAWVIALVAAGGLAAALSTAAGLLLVISTSVSHDLLKKTLARGITDKQELLYARIAAAAAIGVAGYLGINPPGFVAQVVAFAFGLAAASLFPAILMGIFSKRMNKEGAISGMVAGLGFTFGYIAFFKFVSPELNNAEHWWLGISPEGIGMLGAALNFTTALVVSRLAPPAPDHVQALVENIRIPRGATDPQPGSSQAH